MDVYFKIIVRVSGGSEAQESLKKFTDFLETEANRGRISRALEKKILGMTINKQRSKYTFSRNVRDVYTRFRFIDNIAFGHVDRTPGVDGGSQREL